MNEHSCGQWTLKFGLHIIFMSQSILFFFPQALKNVKTTLK